MKLLGCLLFVLAALVAVVGLWTHNTSELFLIGILLQVVAVEESGHPQATSCGGAWGCLMLAASATPRPLGIPHRFLCGGEFWSGAAEQREKQPE